MQIVCHRQSEWRKEVGWTLNLETWDNVAVLISLAARGRGGPRDSLGMIVHRYLETDIYKIVVQAGVLNGW